MPASPSSFAPRSVIRSGAPGPAPTKCIIFYPSLKAPRAVAENIATGFCAVMTSLSPSFFILLTFI